MAQISYGTFTITQGIRQNFWVEATSSEGIPAGIYITQKTAEAFKRSPTTGGPNIFIQAAGASNGIRIRDGSKILAALMDSGIQLYVPNLQGQGKLGLSLDSTNGLQLYNQDSQNSVAAQLNTSGLHIKNGSITLGNADMDISRTSNGSIALTNYTFERAINGTNRTALQMAIGSKFGVGTDGTLYAAGADISGKITVGSGSNVYTTDDVNPLEIGGRNLLLKSHNLESFSIDNTTYGSKTVSNDYITYTRKSGNPTTQYGIYYNVDVEANTDYVLSFDASGTSGNLLFCSIGQITPTGKSNWSGCAGYEQVEVDGRHVRVFNTTTATTIRVYLSMQYTDGASNTVQISNIKLEKGNKATDWTPALEDVQAEIDAKKSIHTLTSTNTNGANYSTILGYANDGTTTNFGVTSNAGVKIGDTVRIAYKVADFTGKPYVYIVGTVNTVNPNGTNVNITAHGLDTTIIDGGNILTNSIGANQIKANSITTNKLAIGDFNNYITANENYPDSITFNSTSSMIIENGWLKKVNAEGSNVWLTPVEPNWTSEGEQYRITGTVKLPEGVSGRANVQICGRDETNAWKTNDNTGDILISADTEVSFDRTITVHSALASWARCNVAIYFYNGSTGSTYCVGYCKNMKCERMSGGSLIVDGAITTDKLDANNINASKSLTIGAFTTDSQSQILNSNAENLLLDTDVPSLTAVNANYGRYFSDSGQSSYVTCSIVPISDPPEPNIKYAYKAVGNGTNTAVVSRALTFNNATNTTEIPFKVGTEYTVSFWGRCTSGTAKTFVNYRYKTTTSRNALGSVMTLTSEWKLYTGTIRLESMPTDYNRVWFYAQFPANTAGTAELCGFKITAGASVSTYITKIDDAGIFISPANQSPTESAAGNSVKINGNGLYIYKSGAEQAYFTGDAAAIGRSGQGRVIIKNDGLYVYDYVDSTQRSVAYFGSSARVGLSSSSHFLMNAASLQAFNASGTKYFEVSSSGLTFGSNTAATTTNVNDAKTAAINTAATDATTKANNAAKTATNYVNISTATGLSGGLTIASSNPTSATTNLVNIQSNDIRIVGNNSNGYSQITSNGLKVYANINSKSTQVANFGSTVTIGQTSVSYVFIDSNGLKIYKGGTTLSNLIASFGDSAQLGKSGAAHSVIDADGQRFYASDGTTQLANIGYASGASASGTATAPYYDFGIRESGTTKGNYSVVEGYNNKASGFASHAEGSGTVASGHRSHAEGSSITEDSVMKFVTASGNYSHAEGLGTTASGDASHAGGLTTIASGNYSHAFGTNTKAQGNNSVAYGYGTIASKPMQVAIGTFNIIDPGGNSDAIYGDGKYLFIIGNGRNSTTNRHNAFTVAWDGYVYTAKDIKTDAVTNIISVNSTNATITSANYVRRGNVAQIQIVWTNKSAISVGESGNITNIQVGTLVSGKRPLIPTGAWSVGDNAGAAWYNIGTGGVITLGACEARKAAYTIAAGSTFWACSTFLVD